MSCDCLPSLASWAAISLAAETSPNCSTRTSGWARRTAATAASGRSTSFFACSSVPRSMKRTTTERPSSDTVPARVAGSSGLLIAPTPLIRRKRLTTPRTAPVTWGSSALSARLPCTSTCSPACSGKPAALTIMSPRLDSPLPEADLSSSSWPTLPPTTAARRTNRIQPRMAVLRWRALHRPARAARLREGIRVSFIGVRTLYEATISYNVRSRKGGRPNSTMSRPEPVTEPRARLSRERVLRAAVRLAARDGIESLTMRKLADELGAGAMSLYHYVPNKEQLLDGMVDIVFAEIEVPTTDVDWKAAMRKRAVSTREALRRHPWAIGLMEGRATHGPANLRLHDAVLGCLRAAGFSLEMTVHAYSVQDAYIYGFALQEQDMSPESADDFAAEAQRQMQDYA